MPKVYIINDMNHNFDKAKKFGELRYATTGKVPIFKTSVAKSMMREGLEGFDVDNDFLLISGPAILCVIAAMILIDGDKPIKTVIFDAKEQEYVVRHLSI